MADIPKVMIIDDSVLVLTVIRHQLEGVGFAVTTREAALGSAAAILREQPDIVLIDVTMPALNGEDLVTLIRKNTALKRTRVLLFSDQTPEALHTLAHDVGADGYITKDTPPATMVTRINTCLKMRPAPVGPQAASTADEFVLFVDTDPGLAALCRAMVALGATGFVHTGQEALRIMDRDPVPTRVFVGTRLGDMRGEDLWRSAVAMDDDWRGKVILLADANAPLPSPTPEGPLWMVRPTSIEAVRSILAGGLS